MKKDHFLTNEEFMLGIYSETIFNDTTRIIADVESVTELLTCNEISNGKIVDLGCGPNLERLVQLSFRFPEIHFNGLDHSNFFIQLARERFAVEMSERRISASCGIVGDLEDASITGFTVFGNMISFEEMKQNEQLLLDIYRCLTPGGFCLLQLPDMAIWQNMNPSFTEEFVLQHTTSAGLYTEEGKRTFNTDSYISEGVFVYKDSDDQPLLQYATRNQLFDFSTPGHVFSIEAILQAIGFNRIDIHETPVVCSPRARGLMSCLVNITCFK